MKINTIREQALAVEEFAIANYNTDGWDFIHETWSTKEIESELKSRRCSTIENAIKHFKSIATTLNEERDSVHSESGESDNEIEEPDAVDPVVRTYRKGDRCYECNGSGETGASDPEEEYFRPDTTDTCYHCQGTGKLLTDETITQSNHDEQVRWATMSQAEFMGYDTGM